jgi:fatty acid desaturase
MEKENQINDNLHREKTEPSTEDSQLKAKYHHAPLHAQRPRDRYFKIRNILNILFMLGAVIGLIVWYISSSKTAGLIIILVAVVLKIIEVALRMFHK